MKKQILHSLEIQAVRILSAAVMLAVLLCSVLYLRGYFDFTFIERVPLTADEVETQTPDTESAVPETEAVGEDTAPGEDTDPVESDTGAVVPSQQGNQQQQIPGNQQQQTPGNQTQTTQKQTAKTVSQSLKKAKTLLSQGWRVQTKGIYQAGKSTLANLSLSGLGSKYTYSRYEERQVITTEYEKGCIYSEAVYVTEDRPAIMLRNGYIIRDVNGKLSLLKPDGTTVLSDYDESTFRLTELRDRNGRALFASVKIEKREVLEPIMQKNEFTGMLEESGEYLPDPVKKEFEVLTYYTLTDDGKWEVSDYTDENPHAESNVGLSFDAPLDYGQSDCDIVRYYEYGQWGYKNAKTGKILIYPRYQTAYNFHDGYAIAFDWYGMHFINEKGETVYSVNYDKPEVFATFNEVTLPDTNGVESLGTYYFSHGLTRIRFRENLVSYKAYYYIKSDDRSVLYDIKGNEYPLPTGYTLRGYSDGVMLLQNNETGLYGCMNYKNEWIVQPQYSHVTPFLSGLAVVGNENGKMGLVDTNGDWVLPQVYDYLSAPSQGMIAAYDKTTGWEIYRVLTK